MFAGAIVLQGTVTPCGDWALERVRFKLGVPKHSECLPGMFSSSGMGGTTNRQTSIAKVIASRGAAAEGRQGLKRLEC